MNNKETCKGNNTIQKEISLKTEKVKVKENNMVWNNNKESLVRYSVNKDMEYIKIKREKQYQCTGWYFL